MGLHEMLAAAEAGRTLEIEHGWGQGRATFGGLVGGLLLARIHGELRAGPGGGATRPQPLRSITVSFVAPAAPGVATSVEAEILRRGSNVTQCHAVMRQDGAVVASALASFGAHRESAIHVAAEPLPEGMPGPDAAEPIPYLEGLVPEFFQHVELRPVDGNLPYVGADTSHMAGWMALVEQPGRYTEEHFVTLADAWPPAVIQMLTSPAPASSLTWTLEFLAELHDVPGDTRWAYRVETDAARDGYAHTCAKIWQPDGTLTAISRQTIAVFG